MSPEKVDIYLVKYPELKTAETLIALVGEIKDLEKEVYDQQLLKEEYLKDCRFRQINPWLFNFLIDPIPDELQTSK